MFSTAPGEFAVRCKLLSNCIKKKIKKLPKKAFDSTVDKDIFMVN